MIFLVTSIVNSLLRYYTSSNFSYYRSSILWVKGDQRIPVGKKSQRKRRKRRRRKHINKQKNGEDLSSFSGNAFVTKKGTLQIRKTELKDGGVYTCMGK